MAVYFLDSSGLVKRYTIEQGTKWILDVVRPSAQHLIYVVRIAGVEVVAALARKRKGKLLSRQESAKAINRFEKHFEHRYRKVNANSDLINAAMKLADKHSLRG